MTDHRASPTDPEGSTSAAVAALAPVTLTPVPIHQVLHEWTYDGRHLLGFPCY